MQEKKCVSVGFRFRGVSTEEQNIRLAKARSVLSGYGGDIITERINRQNPIEVEFIARVPATQYNSHYFDSQLNGSYPKGCGAAWVTDSSECED